MKAGEIAAVLKGSRFFRFFLSGAGVLLFTLLCTFILTELFGVYYLTSYIMVLLTATILNYLLATGYIFRTQKKHKRRFLYYLISLGVFYMADVWMTKFLTDVVMLWYMASILFSRVLFFLLKFVYYKKLLFNDRSAFFRE